MKPTLYLVYQVLLLLLFNLIIVYASIKIQKYLKVYVKLSHFIKKKRIERKKIRLLNVE